MFRQFVIRSALSQVARSRRQYALVPGLYRPISSPSNQSTVLRRSTQIPCLQTRQLSDEVAEAAEWHDVPIVSTTHLIGKKCLLGVYWGDGDAMNVFKATTSPTSNAFHASLEAIMVALRQALYERKLSRVIVQTDSKYLSDCANRYFKIWRFNGYRKLDGTEVKNKEALEEFAAMLDMIDAKIKLSPTEVKVVDLLKKDSRFESLFKDGDMYSGKSSTSETIFVSGKEAVSGKYKIASYGVHFHAEPAFDTCGRFSKFPITKTRAQMYGIIQALELAKEKGLTNIEIVCDSPYFVTYFKSGWMKRDGNPCANHYYYKDIKKLVDEIGVKFSYTTDEKNKDFAHAVMLSDDGLSYPVM